MILLPLNHGRFSLIDDDDSDLCASKWHMHTANGVTMYVVRNVRANGIRRTEFLHKVIASRKGLSGTVDHRNRCGLDNRRDNLRSASRAQNCANRSMHKNNSSGFKGVTWHRVTSRWMARLSVDGRKRHLGLFRDPQQAARAYDIAAREVYGEFAALNFPSDYEHRRR